ncbi:hypothetical protein NKDENANG_00312 [Candidatus Entotheonellaceae bacterium PAL068K]
MRCLHKAIDRLHVAVVSRLAPPIFRHGVASPALSEHLAAVQFELPPLTASRHYNLTAHTLVGKLEAGFQVRRGPQPELPVVVYHHGIAEMPYDKSFRGIFPARLRPRAHLVAVRAPFHRSWLHLLSGLTTLSRFLAMCAVSIKLIEALRQALSTQGARGSLVAGTSLGGFVALMHHLRYGTADSYVPLLAGPDLAHVMLVTHYRRFLAPKALGHVDTIKTLLDFRHAFQASQTHKVFPLLAQYDLDMLYAHHAACYAASQVPVVTIARGHLTGSFAFTALRAHLLNGLRPLMPSAS